MLSAIIVDDSLNQASTQALLQAVSDVRTFADIAVVSTRSSLADAQETRWITAENLVDALAQGINTASSKRVIIISSTLSFGTGDL